MIDSLDAIDWSKLEHAYGEAVDTPELIRQLLGGDWSEAVEELLVSILHQGSVYPATVAALPFLTEVALEVEAPGRLGALQLLYFYGQAIEAGASDGEGLDAEAQAALAQAAQALLPLAADPDPEVRIAIYECACYWRGSDVRQMLRERFAVEGDAGARVALVEPLARHRLLTSADLEKLLAEGPDRVVFAAVWSALASGLELPSAVEHLARLWPGQARSYPGSGSANSLDLLVREAGARAVPLLHRLQAQPGLMGVGDLAEAWVEVARMSRSATSDAVEALISLAVEAETPDLRLAGALAQMLPAAQDRATPFADALAGLLGRHLDLARRPENPADPALQASVATMLFALQDRRWFAPALAAVVTGKPVMVSEGSSQMSFPTALAGLPVARRAVAWAQDELIEVARTAITARPGAAGSWAEVLSLLPASSAVADLLVDVLTGPDREALGGEPVVLKALTELAATDPEVFDPSARATIAALPVTDDESGAWLLTAQAQFTQEDVFGRVWELGGEAFGADQLLRIWTRKPSPAVERACRAQLTGRAAISFPARHLQLAAASFIVGTGNPAEAWPTVRALVDKAGEPLTEAVSVANRIAEREPALRPEWVAQLHDIAENGRQTWSGPDHGAVAIAVRSLLNLGELTAGQAVDQLLEVQRNAVAAWQAVSATPVVVAALREALTVRPDLRDRVAEALDPLLGSDTRIPTAADDIATDVRLVALVRSVVPDRTPAPC